MKFDFASIKDFDKHISLSIPNYDGLVDVTTSIFKEYMPPHGVCVDVGCSTGKLLKSFQNITEGEYIGVDQVRMCDGYPFTFYEADCLTFLTANTKSIDVVISVFTLQFLGNIKRKKVVDELRRLVANGTTLIIAEKVFSKSARVNSILTREHVHQKRKSFTDTEILDKDYELFGSMFCLDDDKMIEELNSIGQYEQIWQSYNFKAWVVYKCQP